MTPLQYCADRAAPRGSSLYFALHFADPAQRPALQVVHAFRAEVTAIPRQVREPAVAQAKLRWWQEELARAFQGTAQHPVTQALQQDILPRHPLGREQFEELLAGVGMDLEYGLYPSFRQLSLYCHRLGGSVAQLAMDICGHEDPQTPAAAHDLGMGFQLLSLLRNLGRDLQNGRLYIPEDELQRAGLTQADLGRSPPPEPVHALLAEQAERAGQFIQQGLGRIAPVDLQAQRPLIILARLYLTLLAELRADGFPVLERRTHLPPLRKLWIAWRTARRPGANIARTP